jgi:alkylation response protein AidB-like acyl-CoA dehydrogenase
MGRITNGIWSHYATMAVRTGAQGAAGLSLLVVPLLGQPGVTMRRMKTSGGTTSGTTFIDLEDVRVPIENLIGAVCVQYLLLPISFVSSCNSASLNRNRLLKRRRY